MNEPEPGAIASRFSDRPVETEADAIVRELAESDPTTDDDDGSRYCVLCGARAQARSERDANERWVLKLPPMTHADTCLWLRARKMAGMG